MKKSSTPPKHKHKIPRHEAAIDTWIDAVDLNKDFSPGDFVPVRFTKLEHQLVRGAYRAALKTKPMTLRLPETLILKLKLLAVRKGTAYQTLIRQLLQEVVDRQLVRA